MLWQRVPLSRARAQPHEVRFQMLEFMFLTINLKKLEEHPKHYEFAINPSLLNNAFVLI